MVGRPDIILSKVRVGSAMPLIYLAYMLNLWATLKCGEAWGKRRRPEA